MVTAALPAKIVMVVAEIVRAFKLFLNMCILPQYVCRLLVQFCFVSSALKVASQLADCPERASNESSCACCGCAATLS